MQNKNIDILDGLEISSENEEKIELDTNSIYLEQEIENNTQEQNTEVLTEYIETENTTEQKSSNEKSEEVNIIFTKEDTLEKKSIYKNSILNSILFFIKYISTSAVIFVVLLLTTNYSAYINIAKSYFFEEQMQEVQTSIISSVEAAKITNNIKTKKNARIKANQEHNNNNASKYSIKNLASDVNKSDYQLDIEITPFENRVIIPKIGKNIPLLDIKNQSIAGPKELENIFMKELENGVIRYPGSTKPGRDGNTFIFGHSSNFPWIKGDYNEVFATLDNVTYGDEVIVYYDQKKYTYKIKEKTVISPGDVGILKRNKKIDEITLMTCWPIGTTLNRLILVGEIVNQEDISKESENSGNNEDRTNKELKK